MPLQTRGSGRDGSTGAGGEARRGRAAGTSGTTSTSAVGDATALVVGGGIHDGAGVGGVDTEADPGQKTVGDIVTKEDVLLRCQHFSHWFQRGMHVGEAYLDDGVAGRKTVEQEEVLLVGGDGLGVGVVGGVDLDGVAQVLVKVQLADVVGGQVVDGAVVAGGGVGVDGDVDVLGTARVVTGVGGQELDGTVVVGELEPTEESVVQVLGGLGEVATRANTSVDTSRVAVFFSCISLVNWAMSRDDYLRQISNQWSVMGSQVSTS